MARAHVIVSNGVKIKTAPVGFSWTVLFFGFFPPLFRCDWLWAIIILLANLLTYGIGGIVLAFLYNKFYLKSLLSNGYWIKQCDPTMTIEDVKAYVGMAVIAEPK